MTLRQLLTIALRYTLNRQGAYLSGYLSSLSVVGIALAICLLLIVLSVMNGFEREMRDNILALVPQLTLKSLQPVTGWREGQERIASFPGVRGVAPYVQTEAMLVHGGWIDTAIVNGISLPDEARAGGLYQRLEASALERFAADSHGVLLGAKLAEKLQVTAGGPVTLITPSRRGRAAEFAYLRVSGLLDTGTEWDHSAALLHLDMASPAGRVGKRGTRIPDHTGRLVSGGAHWLAVGARPARGLLRQRLDHDPWEFVTRPSRCHAT